MFIKANRLSLKVVAVFLLTACAGLGSVRLFEQGEVYRRQQVAMEVASIHGHLLQEQMARSLSATYALAAVLRQGGGRIDNFKQIAGEMLPIYGGISSLQLAPEGVIRHIVPLAGNEAAIGHKLLEDPARNKEAFAALASRKLTLAGPFTLRQGGVAVVGRLPVFLPAVAGKDYFWGFTTALIRIEDLLTASRLGGSEASGYRYALARVHPDTGQLEDFWLSDKQRPDDPLSLPIQVPNGLWTLSIAPVDGWHSSPTLQGLMVGLVVMFSMLASYLAFRLLREPEVLARLVASRTEALSQANASLEEEIVEHWRAEMALRESESQLEKRVEARTQELAVANAALQREMAHQRQLVVRLEDAQNRLLQSEMMASIGQLAAGVAHEINNPISFIKSNLSTLQGYVHGLLTLANGGSAGPGFDLAEIRQELPQLLGDTQEGIARIRRIAQDLKDFAHVDESDWQLLDLNRALESALRLLAAKIGRDVEVRLVLSDIPPVFCLAFQINQVFFNILLNALQAMPSGGVLSLDSRRLDEAICIEIGDSGEGILPEHLGRIFDPFFTTRPVGQGSGLGLSLAYSIVRRHGGRIEVTSTPGQGSRFSIWLPIVAANQG
jgi:signal transduction histidine kinase